MRDATRRRLGPLPTILAVLVLAATVALFVGQLLGFRVYAITTGSMTGTADAGSVIVSRFVPTDDLAVGDVITYVPPPGSAVEHAVTHRIVDIAANDDGSLAYTTKGDANQANDSWSFQLDDPQQLVMRTAVPHIGRGVLFLSDPGTRRLVLGVPALAIAALALLDMVRVWRDRDIEEVVELEDVLDLEADVRPNVPAAPSRPTVVVPRPASYVLDLTQFPADAVGPTVVRTVPVVARDHMPAAAPVHAGSASDDR